MIAGPGGAGTGNPPHRRAISSLPLFATEARREARPDVVYHLAAASSVARSWQQPGRSLDQRHRNRESLRGDASTELNPVVVVSSTAEIYAPSPENTTPLTEDARWRRSHRTAHQSGPRPPHRPISPPVKLRHGPVPVLPPHRPGRPPHFVASSFARQIARIELGLEPPGDSPSAIWSRCAISPMSATPSAPWVGGRPPPRRRGLQRLHRPRDHHCRVSSRCSSISAGARSRSRSTRTDPPIDIPWMVGDPTRIRPPPVGGPRFPRADPRRSPRLVAGERDRRQSTARPIA